MSEVTDWEPNIDEPINWENRYNRLFEINKDLYIQKQQLLYKNQALEKQNQALIRELQAKFTCFKADAITSLKAIAICIKASIPSEINREFLTHRARNFRMKHIDRIISDQIAQLGDRKLSSYEDDF